MLKLNRFKRIQMQEKLHFTQGLYGFEDVLEYMLVGSDEIPFLRLVGGGKTFMIVDPFLFVDNYHPKIEEDCGDYLLLAIVRVGLKEFYLNLAAPILVNWSTKVAKQILLPDEESSHCIRFERLNEFRY